MVQKVQNKLHGLILSSGPPSSAINVDSVGPMKIQGISLI